MPAAYAAYSTLASNGNALEKNVHNTKYGFSIDTLEGRLIKRGLYHSITFPIYRDSISTNTKELENIVFSFEADGTYTAGIMKYEISGTEIDILSKGDGVDMAGHAVQYTKIDISSFDNSYTVDGNVECHVEYTLVIESCNGENQIHGPKNLGQWHECVASQKPQMYISARTICGETDSGGGDGTGTGTGTGATGGGYTGGSSGYFGGTGAGIINPPPPPTTGGQGGLHDDFNDRLTTIVLPNTKRIQFYSGLTAGQQSFLNGNGDASGLIYDYLNENNYSSASQLTVKDAINDILNGTTPYNILNLINKPWQKGVINDVLAVSSPFTNVIQHTFNTNEVVNLQFENMMFPNNVSGNAATSPILLGSSSSYIIRTLLDDNYLNHATNLSIVAVTLHEMVHAYFIHAFLYGQLESDNSNYTTLINAFLVFYKDSNDMTYHELDNEIHNAMIDFIGKMATSIYSYAQSKNMTNVNMDYCIALAWSTMTADTLYTTILTPQQQIDYAQIGYNEQNNTGTKKGTVGP